jgi:hypothetical protein
MHDLDNRLHNSAPFKRLLQNRRVFEPLGNSCWLAARCENKGHSPLTKNVCNVEHCRAMQVHIEHRRIQLATFLFPISWSA